MFKPSRKPTEERPALLGLKMLDPVIASRIEYLTTDRLLTEASS